MYRIADQPQTVRPHTPQELNEHVREVEEKKVEDLAGFGRTEDIFQHRAEHRGNELLECGLASHYDWSRGWRVCFCYRHGPVEFGL
jgi:hypothetical protein